MIISNFRKNSKRLMKYGKDKKKGQFVEESLLDKA